MAETLCLLLAQEEDIRHIRDGAHHPRVLLLAVLQQALLKVGRIVKIILYRVFAAVGNDKYLLNTGRNGFLDNILYNGLVHQWQHFLGDALCVREKSCTEAGGRDYRFSDFHIGSPCILKIVI